MPMATSISPCLFDDDTCLMLKHKNLSGLQDTMNENLDNLHKWCNSNKLTINPSKSAAIIVSPKLNSSIDPTVIKLSINNCPIKITKTAKS